MSAECSYRKKFISTPSQEQVFAIELSGDHAAIRKFIDWKSVFEIGFGGVRHVFSLRAISTIAQPVATKHKVPFDKLRAGSPLRDHRFRDDLLRSG
jgi:hypothetical protein